MNLAAYVPTAEQAAIIAHPGHAFITACPGAGKTRTMVERARALLNQPTDRRGIAFLSFTNAAVDELQTRMKVFGVAPSPTFPSFIGTFDRFLWQFLILPFGVDGCDQVPKLIPDKNNWLVIPFPGAQTLTLRCFDRQTGKVKEALAQDEGFDTNVRDIRAHERVALSIIRNSGSQGRIDFEDVRVCVKNRLNDAQFSKRVGNAVAARFCEVVVDEAQDCNPADLFVVEWLKTSGISTKIICDPNQAIYKFRGGVTDQLADFSTKFAVCERLSISGNFRSTPSICAAITALRSPLHRSAPDAPLGRYRNDSTPVHIIAYGGSGVSTGIGAAFNRLVQQLGLPIGGMPVVASTLASARKAIGQPSIERTEHKTLLLAEAAMSFQFAFEVGNRLEALVDLHRIILVVQGKISSFGDYYAHLENEEVADYNWRPEILSKATELCYRPGDTAEAWLQRAQHLLKSGCVGMLSIKQRLRASPHLAAALATAPVGSPPARTIHSTKGLEFPAVCVVMTSKTSGSILDVLEGAQFTAADEDARKIYVGASRAERLLAIAIPKKTAPRLQALFASSGCKVEVHKI